MASLPVNVRSVVFWSYTISVNGNPIGNLQTFSPESTKQIERVRQIMFETGTTVVDIVPGTVDHTITAERVEIYGLNFFQATGRDLVSLDDMNDPFDILETQHTPQGGLNRLVYANSLIRTYGKNIAIGQTLVNERMTIEVSQIRQG